MPGQSITVEFNPLPPITPEQLRQYAEASGDPNPIHLDEKVAQASGLPGVIAHGMISAAYIAERALQALEQQPELKGYRIARFQSRFKSMVRPGDQIAVGGAIKERAERGLVLELLARNQRGETVTLGSVELERAPEEGASL